LRLAIVVSRFFAIIHGKGCTSEAFLYIWCIIKKQHNIRTMKPAVKLSLNQIQDSLNLSKSSAQNVMRNQNPFFFQSMLNLSKDDYVKYAHSSHSDQIDFCRKSLEMMAGHYYCSSHTWEAVGSGIERVKRRWYKKEEITHKA
jgi:heptaprenylglyceryl phosphate synthase